ncbi:MAG TPA: hypothetical protein VJI67_02315 [archaeon]|nr:hypothetical protein [archaeon]HLD81146.1 hypothetical protein [archaeon]
MKSRGLHQIIGLVIVVIALSVLYLQFMKVSKSGQERVAEALKADLPYSKMIEFEIESCTNSEPTILKGTNLSDGIRVKNSGPDNAHNVVVYYSLRDSNTLQKLKAGSRETFFEMSPSENACFTAASGTVGKRDSIIVKSQEGSLRTEVD